MKCAGLWCLPASRWLLLSGLFFISGCTTILPPDEAVAEGNMQIRLSRLAGAAEGRSLVAGADIAGEGCVLSVLGKMPKMKGSLKVGDCEVSW